MTPECWILKLREGVGQKVEYTALAWVRIPRKSGISAKFSLGSNTERLAHFRPMTYNQETRLTVRTLR